MSVHQAILTELRTKQLITDAENQTLSAAKNGKAFLTSVVNIFENKARLYLSASQYGVKSALQDKSDAAVLEKTMECAFSVFMTSDTYAVVPSLFFLMKRKAPNLLTSLGLVPKSASGDQLKEITEAVFVGYAARYRLFRMVDGEALRTLCTEVETEDSLIFPPYLMNSMVIEANIAYRLREGLQDKEETQRPLYLAELARSGPQTIHLSLAGTIFYLGKLIANLNVSTTLKNKYFQHLNSPEKHGEFIQGVIGGYLNEMRQDKMQIKIDGDRNAEASTTAYKTCCYVFPILGIQTTIDMAAINAPVKTLEKALEKAKSDAAAFNTQLDAAKAKAVADIDTARRNMPKKEYVVGFVLNAPY